MDIVVREPSGERVLVRQGRVARSPVRRMVGLLNRSSLDPDEALVFPRCNSIHTWFMRFPIDVVFLRDGRVVKAVPLLSPFRMAWSPSADTVIEFCQGTVARLGLNVGDRLAWDDPQ